MVPVFATVARAVQQCTGISPDPNHMSRKKGHAHATAGKPHTKRHTGGLRGKGAAIAATHHINDLRVYPHVLERDERGAVGPLHESLFCSNHESHYVCAVCFPQPCEHSNANGCSAEVRRRHVLAAVGEVPPLAPFTTTVGKGQFAFVAIPVSVSVHSTARSPHRRSPPCT